jgi:cyclopropane fatty-acyl-phospholipid synthase-like methyltransferase
MFKQRLLSSLTLLSLFAVPARSRARSLYAGLADTNSLCHEKRYMNLGYWARNPARLDEAGDDMARLVAEAAGLRGGMEVLDAGFGFADQDILWMREYAPARIHGVNCSPVQTARAEQTVAAEGLRTSILLREADATELPYAEASFDAVLSIEAAFHFNTRAQFLREAWRVLRPGGTLAMTDLCAAAGPMEWMARVQSWIGRAFWQIPRQNMHDSREYAAQLDAAGFTGASVTSIWPDVYPRFIEFARARLRDPELRSRMNPVFHAFLSASANARKRVRPSLMDYILVSARKPSL